MTDNAMVSSLFPRAGQTGKKVTFHPEHFHIGSIEQLLFAEELLDAMDADLVDKIHYGQLHKKAEQYVKEHPELLTKTWLRAGGAVHDIIETLRQQQGLVAPACLSPHCH